MALMAIVALTLLAGVGSVLVAALCLRLLSRPGGEAMSQHLLALAAGALLATAFMHLLPEALESEAGAHDLCAVLLVALVFFFLLSKLELWHHAHEHASPHAHTGRLGGGWAVLAGDGVHCFGDGVLIASAFLAGPRYGLLAAASVLAHEVPHHIGDIVVLRQSSANWGQAMLKVSLAGSSTVLGGLAGCFLLEQLQDWLPHFLVLACASFIYVALSDLVPQLQRHQGARGTAVQIACLGLGVALVAVVSQLAHSH